MPVLLVTSSYWVSTVPGILRCVYACVCSVSLCCVFVRLSVWVSVCARACVYMCLCVHVYVYMFRHVCTSTTTIY